MRSLRLLGVAAQAEGLRLKREAALMVRGIVFQAGAAVFGLAALILLHISGYSALAEEFVVAPVQPGLRAGPGGNAGGAETPFALPRCSSTHPTRRYSHGLDL